MSRGYAKNATRRHILHGGIKSGIHGEDSREGKMKILAIDPSHKQTGIALLDAVLPITRSRIIWAESFPVSEDSDLVAILSEFDIPALDICAIETPFYGRLNPKMSLQTLGKVSYLAGRFHEAIRQMKVTKKITTVPSIEWRKAYGWNGQPADVCKKLAIQYAQSVIWDDGLRRKLNADESEAVCLGLSRVMKS
jgi:hypothetical protein